MTKLNDRPLDGEHGGFRELHSVGGSGGLADQHTLAGSYSQGATLSQFIILTKKGKHFYLFINN